MLFRTSHVKIAKISPLLLVALVCVFLICAAGYEVIRWSSLDVLLTDFTHDEEMAIRIAGGLEMTIEPTIESVRIQHARDTAVEITFRIAADDYERLCHEYFVERGHQPSYPIPGQDFFFLGGKIVSGKSVAWSLENSIKGLIVVFPSNDGNRTVITSIDSGTNANAPMLLDMLYFHRRR